MNFLNHQLLKLFQRINTQTSSEIDRAPARAATRLYSFTEASDERTPCGTGVALSGPRFTLSASAEVQLLALPLGGERDAQAYLYTQTPHHAPRCLLLERPQRNLRLEAGVHQLQLVISPERATDSEGYALMAFSL